MILKNGGLCINHCGGLDIVLCLWIIWSVLPWHHTILFFWFTERNCLSHFLFHSDPPPPLSFWSVSETPTLFFFFVSLLNASYFSSSFHSVTFSLSSISYSFCIILYVCIVIFHPQTVLYFTSNHLYISSFYPAWLTAQTELNSWSQLYLWLLRCADTGDSIP